MCWRMGEVGMEEGARHSNIHPGSPKVGKDQEILLATVKEEFDPRKRVDW